jgi:YVTN family beta-propeller protein
MPARKSGKRLAALAAVLTAGVGLGVTQPAGAATRAPGPAPGRHPDHPGRQRSVRGGGQPGDRQDLRTNSDDGTVSVINGRNGTVTSTIDVGSNPVAVAVSPQTGKIYVTNYDDGTVSVIG